jgi:hypothetical protein
MADTKITNLTAATSVISTDIIPVVTGVGGTPATKKISVLAFQGGTAFPATPGTGLKFFRSDLGLECYYDGAQWLTVNVYMADYCSAAVSADSTLDIARVRTDYKIYVTRVAFTTFVVTTNTGSAYWTLTLKSTTATHSAATNVHVFTTATHSPDAYTATETATMSVGAAPANTGALQLDVTKTSTPGNLYVKIGVYYRLIIT